jgi:hypothetical protein
MARSATLRPLPQERLMSCVFLPIFGGNTLAFLAFGLEKRQVPAAKKRREAQTERVSPLRFDPSHFGAASRARWRATVPGPELFTSASPGDPAGCGGSNYARQLFHRPQCRLGPELRRLKMAPLLLARIIYKCLPGGSSGVGRE